MTSGRRGKKLGKGKTGGKQPRGCKEKCYEAGDPLQLGRALRGTGVPPHWCRPCFRPGLSPRV